jgi:hypothetical protein
MPQTLDNEVIKCEPSGDAQCGPDGSWVCEGSDGVGGVAKVVHRRGNGD